MSENFGGLVTTQNDTFEMSLLSVIGDRAEQQDSFGYKVEENDGIVVVCDGMGGHNGGQTASSLTVNKVLEFVSDGIPDPTQDLLRAMATESDKVVSALTFGDGSPLNAGSTLAAVIIKDMSLCWISVGDSRIYLKRGKEFLKVTNDHNYLLALDEGLESGEISPQQYTNELARSEALISYIGLGNIQLMDYSESPLKLYKDDLIIVMTDGLYKLVSDEQMFSVSQSVGDLTELVKIFDETAHNKATINSINRDNMTVAVIKIK